MNLIRKNLMLVCVLFLSAQPSKAQNQSQSLVTVMGPRTWKANLTGSAQTTSFSVAGAIRSPTLKLANGVPVVFEDCSKQKNVLKKILCVAGNIIASATVVLTHAQSVNVSLNGRELVGASNFNAEMNEITVPIPNLIAGSNAIVVRAKGLLTASVTLLIQGRRVENQIPVPTFTLTPNPAIAPETVTFNAMGSTDPDGNITSYQWTFGDGSAATGLLVQKVYTSAGTDSITLTITDNDGAQSRITKTLVINANQPPTAKIAMVVPTEPGRMDVHFDGSASSDPEGRISSYDWDFGDRNAGSGVQVDHTYQTAGTYRVTLTVRDDKGAAASVTQSLTIVPPNAAPIAKLEVTQPASKIAPLMVAFDGGKSSDPDGDALKFQYDFGDGETTAASSSALATHSFVSAGTYAVKLIVEDDHGNRSESQFSIVALAPDVPPTPNSVAPRLSETKIEMMGEQVAFLYAGDNALQKGLQEGALDSKRVAVLRGLVQDEEGRPLSGVRIDVLEMPEIGHTLSRDDGLFDLAVNGGGTLTVRYNRNGYFPLQRKVSTTFQDYFWTDKAIMMKPDPKVSRVTLGQGTSQLAVGPVVSDSSGSRTGALFVPAGTTAQIQWPDGSTRSIQNLSVRLTEFTVGSDGMARMPGPLPTATAYTYAAELSADEAIAADADHVVFSRPLPYYVDNFLGFSPGTAVPLGYFNRATGAWEAEKDGIVAQVLGNENGLAVLDLDGQGVAASSQKLTDLSISSDELRQIAESYAIGRSFWRVQIAHFSAFDLNFASEAARVSAATSPVAGPPRVGDNDPTSCGCIINIQRQTLEERIDLPGFPFSLHYGTLGKPTRSSERTISIPLSGITGVIDEIQIRIQVAGQIHEEILPGSRRDIFTWTWDGLDAYGRVVHGSSLAQIEVKLRSRSVYLSGAWRRDQSLFGSVNAPIQVTTIPLRDMVEYKQTVTIPLSVEQPRGEGFGEWTVSAVHHYNPLTKMLHLGSGEMIDSSQLGGVISRIAGTSSQAGFDGDGGLATRAKMNAPGSLAVAPDGSIYFFDVLNYRIRKVSMDGRITTVVGTGTTGLPSTNVAGTSSKISSVGGLAVAPDGSLYFTEASFHMVLRLSVDGTLTIIGGRNQYGFSGDGGPVAQALFSAPHGIAVSDDGTVFVADTGNGRIRKIAPNGMISTIAGNGSSTQTDQPILNARTSAIGYPSALALGPNHEIYFSLNSMVRVLRTDGSSDVIAGGLRSGNVTGTDIPAVGALMSVLGEMDVGPDGSIYLAESQHLLQITPAGTLRILAGSGVSVLNVESSNPLGNSVTPSGVRRWGRQGIIYSDRSQSVLRIYTTPLPGPNDNGYSIASKDGTELYQFRSDGVHVRTLTARTGVTKWSFEYDDHGYLVKMIDIDGQATRIQRDERGAPSQLIGRYGQSIGLSSNADGRLTGVQLPTGESYVIGYDSQNLMSSFQKPKGNASTYAYNGMGELVKDTDPAGGWKQYAKSPAPNSSYVVKETTSMGRETQVTVSMDGPTQILTTYPDGWQQSESVYVNNVNSTASAGGSHVFFRRDFQDSYQTFFDPRLGGMAEVRSNESMHINGGVVDLTTTRGSTPLSSTDFFQFIQTEDKKFGTAKDLSTYDSRNRTLSLLSGLGFSRKVVLDEKERPVRLEIASFEPVDLTYDSLGRVSSFKQGDRVTNYQYNSLGQVQSVTNALNQSSSYQWDSSGRLLQSMRPDGGVTGYSYDLNGNLASLTPPGRSAHQFVSNLVDLLSTFTPPAIEGGGGSVYLYNADKQMTKESRPDGRAIDFNYSATKGNLDSMKSPNKEYKFAYNLTGSRKATGITSSDGIDVFRSPLTTFDSLRTYTFRVGAPGLVNINQNGAAGIFAPSSLKIDSSMNGVAKGTFTANFTYDQEYALVQIGSLAIIRSGSSRLIQSDEMGPVKIQYGYNNYAEMISREASIAGSSAFTQAFDRDKLGRIIRKVETVGGARKEFSYGYDLAGRLADVTEDGVLVRHYAYDLNGNRTSVASLNATYDAQDRLVQYGDNTYSYDAQGSLKKKTTPSGSTSYVVDDFGQLTEVTLADGKKINYLTGGENQRVEKKVNGVTVRRYVYLDDLRLVAEINPDMTLRSTFVYGEGHSPEFMSQGGVNYRFVKDQLGSIRLVVNAATGEIAQRMDYDEFGQVVLDTNPGFQPFGFAGGIYDVETGLVRFGARDYDPETGRWTSKDPIRFGPYAGVDPKALIERKLAAVASGGSLGAEAFGSSLRVETNLYVYVMSDPVNFTDSTGLLTDQDRSRGAAGAAIGAAIGVGFGVATSAGIASAGYGVAGACIGYSVGIAPGVKRDFIEYLGDLFNNTGVDADNIFVNFPGSR